MGRLAWWRMGLGPGLRRRLCPRICLGCRTRLGLGTWLGTWLGQPLYVCGWPTLRLGAGSSLAFRPSGRALCLALLVISKHPPLAQGNL